MTDLIVNVNWAVHLAVDSALESKATKSTTRHAP